MSEIYCKTNKGLRPVKLHEGDEFNIYDMDNKIIIGKAYRYGFLYRKSNDTRSFTEGDIKDAYAQILKVYSFIEKIMALNQMNKFRLLSIFNIKYMIKIWKAQFVTFRII